MWRFIQRELLNWNFPVSEFGLNDLQFEHEEIEKTARVMLGSFAVLQMRLKWPQTV